MSDKVLAAPLLRAFLCASVHDAERLRDALIAACADDASITVIEALPRPYGLPCPPGHCYLLTDASVAQVIAKLGAAHRWLTVLVAADKTLTDETTIAIETLRDLRASVGIAQAWGAVQSTDGHEAGHVESAEAAPDPAWTAHWNRLYDAGAGNTERASTEEDAP